MIICLGNDTVSAEPSRDCGTGWRLWLRLPDPAATPSHGATGHQQPILGWPAAGAHRWLAQEGQHVSLSPSFQTVHGLCICFLCQCVQNVGILILKKINLGVGLECPALSIFFLFFSLSITYGSFGQPIGCCLQLLCHIPVFPFALHCVCGLVGSFVHVCVGVCIIISVCNGYQHACDSSALPLCTVFCVLPVWSTSVCAGCA